MHDSAVWPLAFAIARRAVLDYDSVIRNGDRGTVTRVECEKFFTGPLFAAMCGTIDPQEMINMVRRGELHRRKPYPRKKNKYRYVRKCFRDT